MSFDLKKPFAALCAAAVIISMCGCSDKGAFLTVDGESINNGVYIYYQQTAIRSAENKVNAALAEAGESAEAGKTVFDYDVEGESASEWVKKENMRLVRQFVAIHKLCAERNISLTDEEREYMKQAVKNTWDEEDMYTKYVYGFDTVGAYYESMGMGQESLTKIYETSALKDKLFLSYYGEDGETPISEEDFVKYVNENYASVKKLDFPFKNYKDEDLKTDSEKNAVTENAKKYAERMSGTESFFDIKYEYDLNKEKEKIRADAEAYYDESPVEGKTREEYVNSEMEKASSSVYKADYEYGVVSVIKKDDENYEEGLVNFVFGLEKGGKAEVYTSDSGSFALQRTDILSYDSWKDNNTESVYHELKDNDFESFLDIMSQNYSIEGNDYFINTKYAPEKTVKK